MMQSGYYCSTFARSTPPYKITLLNLVLITHGTRGLDVYAKIM